MSNQVFLNNRSNPIFIEKQPFASGGEGNIYRIVSPSKYTNQVVKIYHPEKRTFHKEGKVKFLVQNPPDAQNINGHNSVVWATGVIYDNKGFTGLMMPYAAGDKLALLTSSKIPRKFRKKWSRFSFQNPESTQLRMKLCFNIAAAVYQIHSTGRYVLVDLKPDNIIVRPNGLVSIVDVDSMEIMDEGRVLYPAAVTTPEFAPPEFHRDVQPGKTPIFPSWDSYSLAIIFYKLIFGIHPFAGSAKPPYDRLTTLHEKIEQGLFVHAYSKQHYIDVLPPPHRRYHKMMPALQELFLQTFEEGHDLVNRRPSASDWCTVISGKTLVSVRRKLPSRVLQLDKIELSRPRPLPLASNQLLNTSVIPKVQATPPAQFKKTKAMEWIGMSILGVISFTLFKSFLMAMLAGLVVLGVGYNLRPEVRRKRQLSERKRTLNNTLFIQESQVNRLKQAVTSFNGQYTQEINDLTNDQYRLLHEERMSIEELNTSFKRLLSEKDELLVEMEELEKKELEALAEKYPNIENQKKKKKPLEGIAQAQLAISKARMKVEKLTKLKQASTAAELVKDMVLVPFAYKIEQLELEEDTASKALKFDYDVLIGEELKRINTGEPVSNAVRITVEGSISLLKEELARKQRNLEKDFLKKKEAIIEEKDALLQEELDKNSKIIEERQLEIVRLRNQKEDTSNDIEAYNEELKEIEERYNADYQLMLGEGQKTQIEINEMITDIKKDTTKKTDVLFSRSVIPYDASSQYANYKIEAERLLKTKEEAATIDSELKGQEEINFWKYMELILTSS